MQIFLSKAIFVLLLLKFNVPDVPENLSLYTLNIFVVQIFTYNNSVDYLKVTKQIKAKGEK